MNPLDFEIKRSKVKFTTKPNYVQNYLFKNAAFQRNHTGQL